MTIKRSEEISDDRRKILHEELVRCLTILDKFEKHYKEEQKKMRGAKNGMQNEISRLCRILNGEETPRLPFETKEEDPDEEEEEKEEEEDDEEPKDPAADTHVPSDSWRMDR